MNTELMTIFQDAQLRLTLPRKVIFEALEIADAPMTIIDIIKACPSINKVSVYRTVKLFDELNITTTITRGWKHSYELCAPFIPHHHHMACTSCGSLIELQSDKVENLINEIAKKYSFTPSSHHFEVTGVCSNCQLNSNTI